MRVTVNCNCDAIRPMHKFQILNLIDDTEMESVSLVTNLQQTIHTQGINHIFQVPACTLPENSCL